MMGEKVKYRIVCGNSLVEIVKDYQSVKEWELISHCWTGEQYEVIFRFVLVEQQIEP